MPRPNRSSSSPRQLRTRSLLSLFALIVLAAPLLAQGPTPANSNTPRSQQKGDQYKINVSVNLVVLHATVVDKKGSMVNNLTEKDFRVLEDGSPQKLSVFSHADIPVTMGIDIDDSGSMRDKRTAVNEAALTFVKTSNPDDQVFVVNFNDEYYLDTPGNFAANMEELKGALAKIDSRGGTALYDAVSASLDHLKLGNRDKKALLVITDGEDNASRYSFTDLLRQAQQSNAVIYCIGLLGEEHPGGLFKIHGGGNKRAAKILKELAQATGGKAYFPKSLDQVEPICVNIARDIRNQYTLGYYPTNAKRDGSFRRVEIQLTDPNAHKHDLVRTRPGYYAPKAGPEAVAGSQQK
ncbi:MAG TPA: VWA domain-containing protein [Terriglobia bacterium]|nr:VWA domain-containing protein [Terriglobia bacterium]HVB29421.1 VWA domain-containing protein [Terriglobia bacterium]